MPFSIHSISLGTLVPARVTRVRHSPNRSGRPKTITQLACVVLHATADDGHEESAETWLCDSRSGVSAHLHLRRNGDVVRLVDDRRLAWHAGTSEWRGRERVNDFSLGWELANRNDGREPFTAAQYQAVARVAAWYVQQGLPLDAFVSHAEIAIPAGRKHDPMGFDWGRFRAGILSWLTPHSLPDTQQHGGNT